ncbi:unnamed protein product, partial [Rangifer tarandus platyrhynchus]
SVLAVGCLWSSLEKPRVPECCGGRGRRGYCFSRTVELSFFGELFSHATNLSPGSSCCSPIPDRSR